MEGVDLVFHQRDEGRDDQRDPVEEERGELVTERLAPSGGEHCKCGTVCKKDPDDFLLTFPKPTESEMGLEVLGEFGHEGVWNGEGGTGKGQVRNLRRSGRSPPVLTSESFLWIDSDGS